MERPSRDQLGSDSFEDSDVTLCGRPPPDATTQISALPLARESKAIHRPSGDHRGAPVSGPSNHVSRRAPRPSLSATQISLWPLRVLRNATRRPSGENCGLEVSARETNHGTPGLPESVSPSARRHTLMFSTRCEKT